MIAWLQLVRLPTVFSAMADIAMAHAVFAAPFEARAFLLALVVSCLLYLSGMVWNDIFDRKVDAVERPFRPLPSGRIRVPSAQLFAALLMVIGVSAAFAWHVVTGVLAIAIVGCIFLYDAWLKKTFAGPLGMGLCRAGNVLLGVSTALSTQQQVLAHFDNAVKIAIANAIYIIGVTIFAKQEATTSRRPGLILGMCGIALGLSLHSWIMVMGTFPNDHLAVGNITAFDRHAEIVSLNTLVGMLALLSFGTLLGSRLLSAIKEPTPAGVQSAVKTGVLGLIALDAAVATRHAGIGAGLAIACLLYPAMRLGKWLYAT